MSENSREDAGLLTDEQKAALAEAIGPEATLIYVRPTAFHQTWLTR